jgi:hypothetical protein
MPNNDLFINIVYPVIVVLGTGLILFICNRIYRKFKKKKKEITKNITSEVLLKDKLLFEIKWIGEYFREINTKYPYLTISVILINNSAETIIIRDIEVIMDGCIGKLIKEKLEKSLYYSENNRVYIISDPISFPFVLPPNTPKDIILIFMFATTSVIVGNFDIKLYTSHSELVIPITREIVK